MIAMEAEIVLNVLVPVVEVNPLASVPLTYHSIVLLPGKVYAGADRLFVPPEALITVFDVVPAERLGQSVIN